MAGSVDSGRKHDFKGLSVLLLLVDVVVQQFDDEVDMRQNHPSAAVALAAKLVESFPKQCKQAS